MLPLLLQPPELLLPPGGYHYDLVPENWLVSPEALNGASWGKVRASITTDATLAPDGTVASKLTEDGTASATHLISSTIATTGNHVVSFVAKAGGRDWIHLAFNGFSGYASWDIANGVAGTAFSGTATIQADSPDWYRCTYTADTTGATAAKFYPATGDGPAAITYNGDGSSGVYLWHPQLHPGTTLRPYYNGGDLQNAIELYGSHPDLYRGSTTASDANDPALGATGWVGTGTHYGLTGNLSGVTMAGDWSAVLVGLFNGTSNYIFSLAADTANYCSILYNGSGSLLARVGGGGAATSSALAISAVSSCAVLLRGSGGALTLTRLDTGASVSTTAKTPAGTPKISIGSVYGSYIADALTGHTLHFFPNRAITVAEAQRIRRVDQRRLAGKASPITVL